MRACVTALSLLLLCPMAFGEARVYLAPEIACLAPGDEVEISVRVDSADSVSCFLVRFSFDSEIVSLVAAEEGSLFASSGYQSMFSWDAESNGLHSVNDVLLGPLSCAAAPGELARLVFRGEGEGASAVAVLTVDLRDPRRDPILPVVTGGCSLEVTGSSGVPDGASTPCVQPNPVLGDVVMLFPPADGWPDGSVVIHDVAGRRVRRFPRPAAAGAVVWDLRDARGRRVAAGVYFVRTGGSAARVAVIR